MAVNFQSLLSKPVESAKRPVTKPAGTYFGRIAGHKFDESPKQKTPYVRFELGDVQAGPDIDKEQLVDPEDGTPLDLSKFKPHLDYYLTEDALYRLRELLESLGITVSGRSFAETIPESKGMPVQFTLTMEPSRDKEGVFYNNVAQMSGVKE